MENISGILRALVRGLYDSLKGTIVIFYLDKHINEKAERSSPLRHDLSKRVSESPFVKKEKKPQPQEKKVLKRTLQCCGLNGGVFWFSILLFECGLLPLVKYILFVAFGETSTVGSTVWSLIQSFLSLIFSTVWVLPLLLLSKVVNSLWFQDIADSAYRHSRGRPQLLSSFGKLIADALFSVLIQFLFLIQTLLVSYFPVSPFGYLFSLVHTCMLYSLYSFEYKMYNMGWELHKRLNFIEANWPYFIGFGLPLALLTSLTNSYIVSGCIFSILFPLFIISANEADPVRNSTTSQLQLFSPVIAISNALFHRTMTPYISDNRPKLVHRS
ncbi:etoposide-induced protein 2.4 homolog [Cimex lectularius]|uniref:Uncharacterized protein n=1 Tax=Cimex lectularius TaxID=79782 RepID=A0A8I6STJ2_CIMLE|nr:etoposide-induced protein 2.4 homolog [Cimex lectularius]XP_024086135.1 etoposide-induced protein 2.4 homolog [Cimex lectularius]